MKRIFLAVLFLVAQSAPVSAQEHAAEPPTIAHKQLGPADIIMPHLTDSKHIEVPCVRGWGEWACEITLPTWKVRIGATTIDFGPTKHVVFLLLSAAIVALLMIGTARAHVRHTHEVGRPKGFAAGLEAVVLYLRNEIFMPVLGHGGEKFVPFCLSLFFFIALCNLFGLVPYGSTATGNVMVTAGLALLTFVMVEVAGMRALGKGYINTIVYWPHDLPLGARIPLTVIMTPVELIGKFTKPFALTIRLFANMIAGHVVILSLIGLIFLFGAWAALGAIPMALFIMSLEILVAFIQAFIFSLLAAVFIGQIRASHH
ncbi:MAG TPA: F0F1 ATP synthase subunit A [Gemmatimonadaceae bacterium]|nr:F0F1 ATP synthase subunit A [Gemmatimonadaceae bacterium]